MKASMFFCYLHVVLINVIYPLQWFQQGCPDFSGVEEAPAFETQLLLPRTGTEVQEFPPVVKRLLTR